jgi:hypothetical protein
MQILASGSGREFEAPKLNDAMASVNPAIYDAYVVEYSL